MESESEDLASRVGSIEREIVEIKAALAAGIIPRQPPIELQWAPPLAPQQPPPLAPPPPVQIPVELLHPAPPPPRPPKRSSSTEADTVGTWFARIGAIAILIGAGFGFKYAIDRGLISHLVRVAIGLAAGGFFVACGEWAYRRDWRGFAQSIGGAGIALLYLSILAGFELYDLFSPLVAFLALGAIAVGGASIALAHDSPALAVLATLGGFVNAFLIGADVSASVAVLTYIVILDVGIIVIAKHKAWRPLDVLALAATWVFVWSSSSSARPLEVIGYTSIYFLIFAVVPLLNRATSAESTEDTGTDNAVDFVTITLNTFAFLVTGAATLAYGYSAWRGAFALSLAIALSALGLASRRRPSEGQSVASLFFGLSLACLTVAVPLQFHGPWIGLGWVLEGAAIVLAGRLIGSAALKTSGVVVSGIGAFATFAVGFAVGLTYRPSRILISTESFVALAEVAAFAAIAVLLRVAPRGADTNSEARPASRRRDLTLGTVAVAIGNALAIAWLSFEAIAYFSRMPGGPVNAANLQLTLSTIWAIYGTCVIAIGSIREDAEVVSIGMTIIGVYLVKFFFVDLWMTGIPLAFSRILTSYGAFALGLQVAALYISALSLHESESAGSGPMGNGVAHIDDRHASVAAGAAASIVTLAWLSIEAVALFGRLPAGEGGAQGLQLTLSAIWALYAAGILAVGVATRRRWARLGAIAVFGVTIAKMTAVDLWYLQTTYRVAAFIGIGIVLLLCSLMYQRFRTLVVDGIKA